MLWLNKIVRHSCVQGTQYYMVRQLTWVLASTSLHSSCNSEFQFMYFVLCYLHLSWNQLLFFPKLFAALTLFNPFLFVFPFFMPTFLAFPFPFLFFIALEDFDFFAFWLLFNFLFFSLFLISLSNLVILKWDFRLCSSPGVLSHMNMLGCSLSTQLLFIFAVRLESGGSPIFKKYFFGVLHASSLVAASLTRRDVRGQHKTGPTHKKSCNGWKLTNWPESRLLIQVLAS